jgi:restriction endonuclease S subunit
MVGAMWFGVQRFSDLVESNRWKVEFFSGATESAPESCYPLVMLGDVVRESRETVDPQSTPGQLVNYLGLEHVESLTGDLSSFSPRYGRDVKSRCKVFREGAILYGRLRAYLNKVYVAEGDVGEGICSGEFYVLVPDQSRILPRVLRAILASSYVLDQIAKFQSGAALPRVPIGDLLGIRIPLPPMEQQHKLDRFIHAADLRRRRLRAILDAMPQHVAGAVTAHLRSGQALPAEP